MSKKKFLEYIDNVIVQLPMSVGKSMGICNASLKAKGYTVVNYSSIKTAMRDERVRDFARELGGSPWATYWFKDGELRKRIQVLEFIKKLVEDGKG